eukprot:symbB.v1.2.000502.t1/scaffold11.1/size528188/51
MDLLANEVDDIASLQKRLELAMLELWSSLPLDIDDGHLEVRPSRLGVEAGMGLFTTKALPANQLVAHYAGNIHTLKSSMKLQDQQYVMRLGSASCAVDELADGALYVDAGPHLAVKSRYINDCRNLHGYNLRLVCRPDQHVGELFTLRDIQEGEELYFDYGDRYWEDRTASGAACKVLSDEDLEAFKLKEKMHKHNICTLNTMRSVMY